jgi:hypothetical protein
VLFAIFLRFVDFFFFIVNSRGHYMPIVVELRRCVCTRGVRFADGDCAFYG